MIVFNKVIFQGFFSYKDEYIWNIDNYSNTILIEGSNGTGKSTMFEAILWALTGKTLKDVDADEVINRDLNECSVELTFTKEVSGINNVYQVRRSRNRKTGATLFVSKDGENVTCRTTKLTQSLLMEVLGISVQAFTNTILLGEALVKRFTALSDSERKNLVMEMSGLDIDINMCQGIVKEKIIQLNLEILKVKSLIHSKQAVLASVYEGATPEDVAVNILETERSLEIISEKIGKFKEVSQNLESSISVANDIKVKAVSLLAMINDLKDKIFREMATYETISNSICPTCQQRLPESSIKGMIDTVTSNIQSFKMSLQKAYEEYQSLPTYDVEKYKRESLKCKEEIDNLSERFNDLTLSLGAYRAAMDALTKSTRIKQEISDHEEELSNLNKKMESLELLKTAYSSKGLPQYIMMNAVNYINSRLEVYSSILLKRQFYITYDNRKSITIVTGDNISYYTLSSGERKRLDISIQFALHDYLTFYTGVKFNTMLLDEVFESIDDMGIELVIDILREKLTYNNLKSIFVITHNSNLKDYFSRVISL